MENLKSQWVKVYPTYIDKTLPYSEGRKVASGLAIENPTAREIFITCGEYLKLDSVEEHKHHPKDWMKRGRVLVNLKQNNQVKNKNELLKIIAAKINDYRASKASTTAEDTEGKKRRKKKK